MNRAAHALFAAFAALLLLAPGSRAADEKPGDKPPITIGFSIEQTGGLAAVGKTGLLAFQIWAENVNKKGGLLGRPVKLVFYDDQSNPANVPGTYTKLIDIDKVDLIVSSYATNLVAPAMPIVMQKNRLFFGLFALGINVEFHYPKYFSMLVFGPDPKPTFSKGWFEVAMAQNPKPKTIALVTADAEFGRNALDGARQNVKEAGLQIVYDRAYPPTTLDYTPIVRAVQAANPDIVYVASYPPDTVGILRAVSEIGYKPNFLGGTMVGTAAAAFRTQLGPLLNGVVVGENWEPAKTMDFPGIWDFLKQYQPKAVAEGIDPLGYFLPPFAYAEMQVLEERSPRPAASTRPSSPTTSTAIRSRPWSARSISAPMANGPSRRTCSSSITASSRTTSSSSATIRILPSSTRRNSRPASCSSRSPRRGSKSNRS